ncbi:ribonuclease H-like domain-containing protein, partial [Tanacetum coccineum]
YLCLALFFIIIAIRDPSGSRSAVTVNGLDASNPLHVQNTDNSNSVIIPFKLLGTENYRIWSGAVKLALQDKNKYGFVDGTCLKESYTTSDVLSAQWDRCNVMVLTWIMNVVSQDVYLRLVYSENAVTVWKELNETYDKIDVKCSCDASKELGFKRNYNTSKQNFNANVDVKINDKPSSSLSSGFNPEQMEKLLSMINDKPSRSNLQYHVGCRASFFNGKSNVVMCFHVSKLLRHNRLGHPADQVLYMLKNDLSISDNSSVPMCEVCKRAKQTREPFPLSDHKSKTLRLYGYT